MESLFDKLSKHDVYIILLLCGQGKESNIFLQLNAGKWNMSAESEFPENPVCQPLNEYNFKGDANVDNQ